MANKKITARTSLASVNVDPVTDLLGIIDSSAGAAGDKKITINNLFAGWGMTSYGAALCKANTLEAQKAILGINDFSLTSSVDFSTSAFRLATYFINTSSNTVEMILPPTPELMDRIEIFDIGNTFATNNLTLVSADNFNGSPGSLVCDIDGVHLILIYYGGAIGWRVF